MVNRLSLKLSSFADLSANDQIVLDDMTASARRIPAGETLIRQGDRPENVFLLLDGWAYRYKVVGDRKQQIVALMVPGDLGDNHIFMLKRADHGIRSLGDATVATISEASMLSALRTCPTVARAFAWATLVDEATLREWLANIGQRDAYQRIAHLFCEMHLRLSQVGLVRDGMLGFPLTQEQIGNAVGLTAVHVNRTLRRMNEAGHATILARTLRIGDVATLRKVANFDPDYLHLDRRDDV